MSIYYRHFFRCRDKDCRFIVTTLNQANTEFEAICPACGQDMDYAPTEARKEYARTLARELEEMEMDGEM